VVVRGEARRAEAVQDAREGCRLIPDDVCGVRGGRDVGLAVVLRPVWGAGLACGLGLAAMMSGGCAGDGRGGGSAASDRTPMVGLENLTADQTGGRPGTSDTGDEPENEIERQIRAQQLAMRGGSGLGFDENPNGSDWSSGSTGRDEGAGTDRAFRVDPVPFPFDVHDGGGPRTSLRTGDDRATGQAVDAATNQDSPSTEPARTSEPAELINQTSTDIAPGGRPSDSETQRRARELAVELAEILRVRAIEGGEVGTGGAPGVRAGRNSAMQEALRLVFLDAIEPGTASLALADALGGLNPAQREILSTLRDAVADMSMSDAGSGRGDSAGSRGLDAGALADRLRRAAKELVDEPLSMPMVALCTRVESFGRYTPLAANRFMVGRTTPLLVYAEVENFKQAPAAPDSLASARHRERGQQGMREGEGRGEQGGAGDVHEVRLSIELGIYPESGDPLVYHFPADRIRDTSRRARRDFFVVRRIDVPPTLNTGSYVLKVTLTDEHSGDVAERVIPFTVVADPSLLRR